MTRESALELLKQAPRDDKPSKVNPALTRKQVVEIVEAPFLENDRNPFDGPAASLIEKRVWQAVKDQRRPKYRKEHW